MAQSPSLRIPVSPRGVPMNEKTSFLRISAARFLSLFLLLAYFALAPGTAGAGNSGGHPLEVTRDPETVPPTKVHGYIGGDGNHATYPSSGNNVKFVTNDDSYESVYGGQPSGGADDDDNPEKYKGKC